VIGSGVIVGRACPAFSRLGSNSDLVRAASVLPRPASASTDGRDGWAVDDKVMGDDAMGDAIWGLGATCRLAEDNFS
jgi:hypothetical protein